MTSSTPLDPSRDQQPIASREPAVASDSPRLRLYIARSTPNSVRAEQNLKDMLGSLGAREPPLVPDIIDVFVNSKRAVADGVIVTPTLVVIRGDKRHTIVGDLADVSQLRALLL